MLKGASYAVTTNKKISSQDGISKKMDETHKEREIKRVSERETDRQTQAGRQISIIIFNNIQMKTSKLIKINLKQSRLQQKRI